MNEENKKKADQTWKEQVSKEKEAAKETNGLYQEPSFTVFLSSLGMQAMIAIGKMENPLTNKIDKNINQARFLIDTLEIIKENTKNNLNPQETSLLDDYLFNLRMMYLEEVKLNEK